MVAISSNTRVILRILLKSLVNLIEAPIKESKRVIFYVPKLTQSLIDDMKNYKSASLYCDRYNSYKPIAKRKFDELNDMPTKEFNNMFYPEGYQIKDNSITIIKKAA